jgi:L-cysteine S-thiosulfotransferase
MTEVTTVAVRAHSLAQFLLALLLTASAAMTARAESDWVESVFPAKETVLESVRKPPAKPERLVKSANRARAESEAAKNREKQLERRQAERDSQRQTERQAEARGKADAKTKHQQTSSVTTPSMPTPSNAAQPAPVLSTGTKLPTATATATATATSQTPVSNDDTATRMRLGGVPPLEAPAATAQALAPITQPSWLPAPTIANPAAGPVLGKQEATKPTASAADAAEPTVSESNTPAALPRNTSKPREIDNAPPSRPAASTSSISAGATVTVAAVTQAAKAVALPPPATDSLEPEARAAAIARGQHLWMQRRGPRHASLEECNLGLGAGRVVGTFAHLPRYFADANKVMDLESRIVWCAKVAQDLGLDALLKPRTVDGVTATELEDLAVYVASLSASWRLSPPSAHAKESVAYEVGQALYARRQGPLDFSCATCHGTAGQSGGEPQSQALSQPIRFWKNRPVPQLGSPAESQASIGNWPAWRAAHGRIQTLQGRIAACFGHMGVEPPAAASDAAIALAAYLTRQAEKGEVLAPGRKR